MKHATGLVAQLKQPVLLQVLSRWAQTLMQPAGVWFGNRLAIPGQSRVHRLCWAEQKAALVTGAALALVTESTDSIVAAAKPIVLMRIPFFSH